MRGDCPASPAFAFVAIPPPGAARGPSARGGGMLGGSWGRAAPVGMWPVRSPLTAQSIVPRLAHPRGDTGVCLCGTPSLPGPPPEGEEKPLCSGGAVPCESQAGAQPWISAAERLLPAISFHDPTSKASPAPRNMCIPAWGLGETHLLI